MSTDLDRDEAFESYGSERDTQSTYAIRGEAALPPAPSREPREQGTRLTEPLVLSVCAAVRGFMPLHQALRAHGVLLTAAQIEERASQGGDPFMAWAVACFGMADAAAVAVATSKMFGIATDDGHKKQFDALKFYLERRTTDFTASTKVAVDHKHSGTVTHVAARTDELLQAGTLTMAELAGRLRAPRALPEPEPIDAEFEEVAEKEVV